MSPALAWVRAFGVTLAIEEGVVLAMTRAQGDTPRRAALVAFANLATHPSVWFVLPLVFSGDVARIVASEVWAVVIEALFYALTMKISASRAFAISAIANAVSFGLGVVLRVATGWV
jgi:hypothetical protein